MADLDQNQIIGTEPQTQTETPAAPQAQGTRISGAVVQRKMARRLARRGVGESFAPSVGGEGLGQGAAEVGEKGFSGGGHEVPHREEMEKSFGADFSGVKAHTDGNAAAASEKLDAHAYTMGNDVAFKNSSPDKATVAHELTHVVQQSRGGSELARKADGADVIDTSGEAEAHAVEDAVRAGKPASEALQGGAGGAKGGLARKKIQREEAGSKFCMGMSFSREGFEKSYEYTIWNKSVSSPTPIPGVNFIVDPSVKVFGKGGVKYAGQDKGDMSLALGVSGDVGLGVSGGVPNVAEVYLTGNPGIEGAGTFTKKSGEGWSLTAGITAKMSGKIGVKLGGGITDHSFELFGFDIFKLTGLYWDQTGFRKDKIGFEWGDQIKAIFNAIKAAIEKAKALGAAAVKKVKQAGQVVHKAASTFVNWVSSW